MATDMGAGPQTDLTPDAKNWGMLCHISGLAFYVGPGVFNIVAPLVVWML
jgi:uncharacterized Tic20 family protein